MPSNIKTFADDLDDVRTKLGSHLGNPLGLKLLSETSDHPRKFGHKRVTRIILPYLSFDVNVWVYETGQHTYLIDSSSDGVGLIAQLNHLELTPTALLTTHDHPDHVGGIPALNQSYPDLKQETEGEYLSISTPGHCQGHLSYYFPQDGICFCGDALFAGSMGKPNDGIDVSLQSLRTLLDLPPETLLFPGHGPATQVEWERLYNCFYLPL